MGWPFSAYGFGKFLGGSQPGFPGFGNLLGDSWTGFFLLLFFVSLLLFLFLLLFLPLSFFGGFKKKVQNVLVKNFRTLQKMFEFSKNYSKIRKKVRLFNFCSCFKQCSEYFCSKLLKKIKISKNVPFFKKNSNIPEKIVVLNLFRFFKECS